jgi:PAS domain S-box-containing protein
MNDRRIALRAMLCLSGRFPAPESIASEKSANMGGATMMRLRAMLLLPLGLFVLFWIVYLVAVGDIGPVSLFSLLALLLVGLTLTNTELLVLRPLRGLIRAAQDLAQNRYSGPPAKASPAPMRELAAGLDRLRDRMHVYEAKLAQERTRRQALEQSVRELEDRYALTVERANDGIWEWNLQSGAVDFSLRWKALLGRTNAHMGHIEDWRKLLHHEDDAAVMLSLENHLNGLTQHFDKEYRLCHHDGHYRWIHSRGTAIRHAGGKPYRMVVMDNDIHERKQIEEALINY